MICNYFPPIGCNDILLRGEEKKRRKLRKLPETGEERTIERQREKRKEKLKTREREKRGRKGRESEVEACGGLWAGAAAASA